MNRNQVLPQTELSSEPKALRAVDLLSNHTYRGTGFLSLNELPRLAKESAQIEAEDGFHWEMQTYFEQDLAGDPRQKMRLRLSGRIQLVCQRCMQPCFVSVNERRQFVFVADEAEADAYPMEDDEQEPIVISAHFDLLATIEDEILLSLPLIPKHAEGACESTAFAFPATPETNLRASEIEKPENPFNILKNIKKKD